VHEQDGGALGQPHVHLVDDLPDPLELVHPQHRRPVGQLDAAGVQRLARRRRVPGRADVPLHAAGEPRVAQCEVGGLEDRVAVEQLASGWLVHERPQASASAEQERCPQSVVLQHGDGVFRGGAVASVTVLKEVGQD